MEDCSRQIEFGTLAEQTDETHYDNRPDADDDIEKGRIKFPNDKLYGRNEELQQFHSIVQSVLADAVSRIVFLGGYSGTGKSTLVDEFIKQAAKANLGRQSRARFWKVWSYQIGRPFHCYLTSTEHIRC